MFKSGEFTEAYVRKSDGSRVPERQIQPHGIELTVDSIYRLSDYCVISDDVYSKAPRREATLIESGKYVDKSDSSNHKHSDIQEYNENGDRVQDPSYKNSIIQLDDPHYCLIEGPYVVVYDEQIQIPDGHMGVVWPRSRLIRNNNYLSSAVWDSGYQGQGEGGLHINSMTFIEKGMRLGQLVLARAENFRTYNGEHQSERLNDDNGYVQTKINDYM
jgi:dUTP pyrophosphatase